jgi:hypothetical protein
MARITVKAQIFTLNTYPIKGTCKLIKGTLCQASVADAYTKEREKVICHCSGKKILECAKNILNFYYLDFIFDNINDFEQRKSEKFPPSFFQKKSCLMKRII